MIQLTINGSTHQLDIDPQMPLLWAIRDSVGLTGTKYGCGMALCGACTVHVDGEAVRSCTLPVSAAEGKRITTIEGLDSATARQVQAAWERLDVVQCGYCQSGQIMSAVALLSSNPQPSDENIHAAMSGNICRCSTYVRIRAAIREASRALAR
jgi:isoquinoline 1-oxidoreductase alpha subunit